MNIVEKCNILCYIFLISFCVMKNVNAKKTNTGVIAANPNVSVYVNLGRYLRNFGSWLSTNLPYLREEAGRCIGAGLHKLQLTFMPIFYKLGVIGTMLTFLTMISLKGLTVGIIILILSLSNFLAKFHIANHAVGHDNHEIKNVHVHIHPTPYGHFPHYRDDHHQQLQNYHEYAALHPRYEEMDHPTYYYSSGSHNKMDKDVVDNLPNVYVDNNNGYFGKFMSGLNLVQ